MAGKLTNLIKLVLPKKGASKPIAYTNTYSPGQANRLLAVPQYFDHLSDIQTDRVTYDAQTLQRKLFKYDPDVSAAVNAYLTVSDTPMVVYVRDLEGNFDLEGHRTVNQLLQALTSRIDYSKGYQYVIGLRSLCERLRYMTLLRGGVAVELVLDKNILPYQLNIIDLATVSWAEVTPGVYTPWQTPKSGGNPIDLGRVPTFFTAFFRQDPTDIYSEGTFVSAINTIAARQQVINDLYRIMQATGWPRMDIKVLEEVLIKSAPANVRSNANELRLWVNARLNEIGATFASLRPDQAFVHPDSVEVSVVNEDSPSVGVDITHVVNVLNGQNQAALKTMATIIGRGESGVNTASVEARIFSMNADQVNVPVSEILSQVLTYCLRLLGSESSVEIRFREAELRSSLELEPQMTLKAARLKEDLSLGVISDLEYHMEMHNRPPLQESPQLSGTNFMRSSSSSEVSDKTTPNSDPLGRSQTGEGGKQAKSMTKSNAVRR